MSQLLIRRIDDDVKERLRRRALRHGRSMEAEVRDILRDVLKSDDAPTTGLGSRLAARFKNIGLRDGEELPELRGHEIKSPFEE
jgi:plasmid stability protein